MKKYNEFVSHLEESSGGQGKVETKKYSWGTMKTVHHGASFSIPLHPEHHQAISKLKDEQEHKFKDETGRHWVARRKGDNVHFDTTGNGSMKTHVPLHTMHEETHSELARQAASKYRTALARGDSVGASQAAAERLRHKRAAAAAKPKPHVPGEVEESVKLSEAKVTDLDTYFDKIEMKGGEAKPKARASKEPSEPAITGNQIKFFNSFREELELSERMNLAKASMGDVVKDFQQSDAPQFVGKSKEKKRQMAIAAKLEADRQQTEGVIQPSGDDKINVGEDVGKTTVVKDKQGKVISFKHESEWRKATGKDPRGRVTNMSDKARREAEKLTKEEVELDEAFINGREYASQGVMHPDHAKMHKVGNAMDFYAHGTGDKISGKVTKNDGKAVHIQADKSSGGKLHKFTVTPHLPKPVNEEVEELEEAAVSGNKGYGYHGQHESDVADKKYSAAHATVKKVAGEAGHLRDAKKPNVMVTHYLDSRHGRHLAGNESDHEYIKKDFGKFKKSYKESDFAKEEVEFDDEGNFVVEQLTYEQFVAQLNEYTPGPNGVTRVQGRSYGAQYHDPEGDDDADDRPAKKAEQPKKGRGRPAGSKSGANVKRLSSKGSNGHGYDSTGFKLHLPNSNK